MMIFRMAVRERQLLNKQHRNRRHKNVGWNHAVVPPMTVQQRRNPNDNRNRDERDLRGF